MVKNTQTIRWEQPTNCLSVFDHFMGLALKWVKCFFPFSSSFCLNYLSLTLKIYKFQFQLAIRLKVILTSTNSSKENPVQEVLHSSQQSPKLSLLLFFIPHICKIRSCIIYLFYLLFL